MTPSPNSPVTHGWSACITTPTDSRLASLRHALIVAELQEPLAYLNLFSPLSQMNFTHLVEHVYVVFVEGSG